jgi:hypothetical protein
MTILEVYERLLTDPVNRIEWKDGSPPLKCPFPQKVGHAYPAEGGTEIDIGVSAEGLSLHFNAKNEWGDFKGHSEPLNNIAKII